jgi:hypothetical protein
VLLLLLLLFVAVPQNSSATEHLNIHHQRQNSTFRRYITYAAYTRAVKELAAYGSVGIEALRYKLKGRGFKTRLGERFPSISINVPAALDPRVYTVPNINEYQKQKNVSTE